ncbi:unnamed protein product [Diamesa hyperborea]
MSPRAIVSELPQNIHAFYCFTCVKTVLIKPPNRACPDCKLRLVESIALSVGLTDLTNVSPPNLRRFMEKFYNRYQRNTMTQKANTRFIDETLPRILHAIIQYVDGTDLHGFIAGHMSYEVGKQQLELRLSFVLDQIEHDPLPLTEEEMNNIQKEIITIEQVEANQQCAVCLENFDLEEVARKLNCTHYYHESCIFSWVKQHSTCPVCRKYLNAEQGTEIFPTAEGIMMTLKSIAESRDLLRNLRTRYEMAERFGINFDSDSDSSGSNNIPFY